MHNAMRTRYIPHNGTSFHWLRNIILLLLLPCAASANLTNAPINQPVQTGVLLWTSRGIDDVDFTGCETYVEYLYPPFCLSRREREFNFYWVATAGVLGDDETFAGMVSGGLKFGLRSRGRRMLLHAGSRFAWLSEHEFEEHNLGGEFQFISHLGLSWQLTKHIHGGIRGQHLSNSGMYDANPGLEMMTLDLGWTF